MNPKFLLSLVITLIVLFAIQARAQDYDTTLYRSYFEEKVVKMAIDGKTPDYVGLFCGLTSDSIQAQRYTGKINSFYKTFDAQVNGVKAPKVKAKLIFKEVHAYFLKQYHEEIFFNGIFETGEYNCVTASMLYALVLQHYGIPFEIMEKPTHIYLVAYPGAENILFETTNPKGFMVLDDKAKRQYVAGLVSLKYTTQEYVNTVGIAGAFNEFYYNNESVSMTQLGGIQYSNQAIVFFGLGNINKAFRGAVKAQLLYPCAKTQLMKVTLIENLIRLATYETFNDIMYLCEYSNTLIELEDRRSVLELFETILDDKLISQSNDSLTTAIYTQMVARLSDKTVSNDITYLYMRYMASWYGTKGDMPRTIEYAEKAYDINPKDARLREMIARSVMTNAETRKVKDADIKLLANYETKFSFLADHKTFQSLKVYQYGMRAIGHFFKNEGPEGFRYMEMIEAKLAVDSVTYEKINDVIGMVYAEAGSYHFRRKEFQKAKAILLRGLKIAPDLKDLKDILGYVQTELNGG